MIYSKDLDGNGKLEYDEIAEQMKVVADMVRQLDPDNDHLDFERFLHIVPKFEQYLIIIIIVCNRYNNILQIEQKRGLKHSPCASDEKINKTMLKQYSLYRRSVAFICALSMELQGCPFRKMLLKANKMSSTSINT